MSEGMSERTRRMLEAAQRRENGEPAPPVGHEAAGGYDGPVEDPLDGPVDEGEAHGHEIGGELPGNDWEEGADGHHAEGDEGDGPGDLDAGAEEDEVVAPSRRRTAVLAAAGVVVVLAAGGAYALLSRHPVEVAAPVQDAAAQAAVRARVAAARAAAGTVHANEQDPSPDDVGKVPTGIADAGRPKPANAGAAMAHAAPAGTDAGGAPGMPPTARGAGTAPAQVATAAPRPAVPPPPVVAPAVPPPPAARPKEADNPFAVPESNGDGLEKHPDEVAKAVHADDAERTAGAVAVQVERTDADPAPVGTMAQAGGTDRVVPGAVLESASQYGGRVTIGGRAIDYRMKGTLPGLGTVRDLRAWGDSYELVTDAGVVRPAAAPQ